MRAGRSVGVSGNEPSRSPSLSASRAARSSCRSRSARSSPSSSSPELSTPVVLEVRAGTGGEEAAIFAAADSGTVGTDAVDGDVVSFAGATVDIGGNGVDEDDVE